MNYRACNILMPAYRELLMVGACDSMTRALNAFVGFGPVQSGRHVCLHL
jgi:hypothetical protein